MSAAVVGLAGIGAHRHVEQVMGMPISVALRGRHATTTAGRDAWRAVIEELRAVDRVFSTYRPDSVISRLNQGEIAPEQ
jgi:thiamine biosynthesis lipoprotein